MKKAFLILADGSIFEGCSIGLEGCTIGETVFTTGMTGYLETLTDPSYYGQIVTQTFPLIGNYGVIAEDFESSKSWVRGYIVRELCDEPSNFRSTERLDNFLKKHGVVGLCGIDTRALTKKLRESGVMNGMIASGLDAEKIKSSPETLKKIKEYKIENAVKSVQDKMQPKENNVNDEDKKLRIVLWNFGAKKNIQRELEKRGCSVTIVPCNASAQQIISLKPDGVMLSNGPGDPAENKDIISEIKKLCEFSMQKSLPIFGICLGHQMLALARGLNTVKLKYGHRGGNHPVKNIQSERVYITSQNHGYAVEAENLPPYAKLTFQNVNDGTCEGLCYTDIPAFSVQFHPEACGGPHDTNFLFDTFLQMILNGGNHAVK